MRKNLYFHIFAIFLFYTLGSPIVHAQTITVGAAQIDKYLPLLKDKRVALVVNQTSRVNQTHLVDTLNTL